MQNSPPRPRLRRPWAFTTRLNCKQAFFGWSDAEYRGVVDSKNEEALILGRGGPLCQQGFQKSLKTINFKNLPFPGSAPDSLSSPAPLPVHPQPSTTSNPQFFRGHKSLNSKEAFLSFFLKQKIFSRETCKELVPPCSPICCCLTSRLTGVRNYLVTRGEKN